MKIKIYCLLIMPLFLVSCWEKSEPKTYIRPVKVANVESLAFYEKDFVGVVSAGEYVDLAFRVSGLILKTYAEAGTNVRTGQILAELDPSDLNLRVDASRASFETASSIIERNKKLLAKGAISQQDYEMSTAQYSNAKSEYEYNVNQLNYSKLRAPYGGSIEKKYVEQYQKINTGEPIYKLINPDILEIDFTLPENDVVLINSNKRISVEFDNHKGVYFNAEIKDVVQASTGGSGIPVTLRIKDERFSPKKLEVKAGFSCRVKLIIENTSADKNFTFVPITAIFTERKSNNDNRYVWIYNSADKTVSRRQVKTNVLIGKDLIVVESGIQTGEQVVTAGVQSIEEGQTVNILNN